MNNLKIYTRIVKTASSLLMATLVGGLIAKWIFNLMAVVEPGVTLAAGCSAGTQLAPAAHSAPLFAANLPFLHRLTGFTVDGLFCLLLLVALWLTIKLMNRFERGDIFSSNSIDLIALISKIIFAWACYVPVSRTLLSIITTLHRGPGQRVLEVSLHSSDVLNLLMFGFLMVVALLMQEGKKLQLENDLTV